MHTRMADSVSFRNRRARAPVFRGQYCGIWGNDYRQTANDDIIVVAMIESPSGVAIADEIAAVPGVDVVMAASTDPGSFSGLRQGEPAYERMLDEIVAPTEG